MSQPIPVNVVPTQRARAIAHDMIADAENMPGADAFVNHAHKIRRDDIPAIFGLLLTATKQHKKLGRPPQPITYTREEMLQAKRQHKAGMRDEWTLEGKRQYERLWARKRYGRKTLRAAS